MPNLLTLYIDIPITPYLEAYISLDTPKLSNLRCPGYAVRFVTECLPPLKKIHLASQENDSPWNGESTKLQSLHHFIDNLEELSLDYVPDSLPDPANRITFPSLKILKAHGWGADLLSRLDLPKLYSLDVVWKKVAGNHPSYAIPHVQELYWKSYEGNYEDSCPPDLLASCPNLRVFSSGLGAGRRRGSEHGALASLLERTVSVDSDQPTYCLLLEEVHVQRVRLQSLEMLTAGRPLLKVISMTSFDPSDYKGEEVWEMSKSILRRIQGRVRLDVQMPDAYMLQSLWKATL